MFKFKKLLFLLMYSSFCSYAALETSVSPPYPVWVAATPGGGLLSVKEGTEGAVTSDAHGILDLRSLPVKYLNLQSHAIHGGAEDNQGAFDHCTKSYREFEKVKEMDHISFVLGGIRVVLLPATITGIGNRGFIECKSLREVDFSSCSSLEKIDTEAFVGSSLEKIKFPTSIKVIDRKAFIGCRSLKELDLRHCTSLEGIMDNAFMEAGLEKITLPPSIRWIGSEAFARTNLKVVDLGDCHFLEGMAYLAFVRCHKLKNVVFPQTRSKGHFSDLTLEGCKSLRSLTLGEGYKNPFVTWVKGGISPFLDRFTFTGMNTSGLDPELTLVITQAFRRDFQMQVTAFLDFCSKNIFKGTLPAANIPACGARLAEKFNELFSLEPGRRPVSESERIGILIKTLFDHDLLNLTNSMFKEVSVKLSNMPLGFPTQHEAVACSLADYFHGIRKNLNNLPDIS